MAAETSQINKAIIQKAAVLFQKMKSMSADRKRSVFNAFEITINNKMANGRQRQIKDHQSFKADCMERPNVM